jgi:hypothetical protein
MSAAEEQGCLLSHPRTPPHVRDSRWAALEARQEATAVGAAGPLPEVMLRDVRPLAAVTIAATPRRIARTPSPVPAMMLAGPLSAPNTVIETASDAMVVFM